MQCDFITFAFMHLADAVIQSDLQCIQAKHVLYMCSLRIEPTTFCAANAMLYYWATGSLYILTMQEIESDMYRTAKFTLCDIVSDLCIMNSQF